MIRGADWYLDQKGNFKVNLGGYQEPQWKAWQKKFCWVPKKITLIGIVTSDSSIELGIRYTKWVWLKTIYVRKRAKFGPIAYPHMTYEYQYAEDLFDLMQKESQ